MVIFTARQNLANLNEVKMNLIVKLANLAGKSYTHAGWCSWHPVPQIGRKVKVPTCKEESLTCPLHFEEPLTFYR